MKNTQLLKHAIDLLESVNPEELETVQINGTKYDDGSYAITIDLTYPENKGEDKTTRLFVDGVKYELFDRKAHLGDQVVYCYKGNIGGVISEVVAINSDGVDIIPYTDTDENEVMGYAHGAYLIAVRKESIDHERNY